MNNIKGCVPCRGKNSQKTGPGAEALGGVCVCVCSSDLRDPNCIISVLLIYFNV